MAQGLKVPMGVNSGGGMLLSNGDENDNKIIKAALTDNENDNAFQQDIGFTDDIIFDFNDPRTRARITRRLKETFKRFKDEKRFDLLENTIKWDTNSKDQELILSFRYINLESDEEKEFEDKFGASSFGG